MLEPVSRHHQRWLQSSLGCGFMCMYVCMCAVHAGVQVCLCMYLVCRERERVCVHVCTLTPSCKFQSGVQ